MLPGRRTLEGSTAISFITSAKNDGSKNPSWQTFELTNGNLSDALAFLEKEYRHSMLYAFFRLSKPEQAAPQKLAQVGTAT
jgi:hypothetical protein